MPDWGKSMQQTFEFCTVDPLTWQDSGLLTTVKSCSITRDADSDTKGNASIEYDGVIPEGYVRVYLVTIQNGIKERIALGTYLVQSPSFTFDGKVRSVSADAYTPLLELNDTKPDIGYTINKETNILSIAAQICKDHCRAPVNESASDDVIFKNYTAGANDSWLKFLTEFIRYANHRFDIDAYGHVMFAPIQDEGAIQPVWTFDTKNTSILYPDISVKEDYYSIPNVVEVVASTISGCYTARVVNDDPDSEVSTVTRGREIIYRDTDPNIGGIPTDDMVESYAKELLRSKSKLTYEVSFKHGYCPVRVGDAVYINYPTADLNYVKAIITSQTITCTPGTPVSATAIYTRKLWEG